MIKQLAGILVLMGISVVGICQEAAPAKKKSVRPDIPGMFTVDFGFNRALSAPVDFDLYFWGSRTVNIYYQYDFRLFKSPISVVPGIGFSLERYRFKDNYAVGYTNDSHNEVTMLPPGDLPTPNIKKSMLVTNYLEVPVELRYTLNPEDPSRSFKISVGGRIGWMYDSFNKIKYSEDGEVKKLKDKQDYHLNPIRYGLLARLGFGGFSLFCNYNLSPLFRKGEGIQTNNESNDFNTLTFGISVSNF
ncbi:MAG: outer membrane beta-barrel protein [Chryseolinea sp.]